MPSLGSSNDVRVTISTSADTRGVKQAEQSISSLRREGETATGSAGGLSSAFGGFGKVIGTLGGIFAAAKITQYLSDFATMSVGTAASLQQTNMAFQSLIGNAQDANKFFADLTTYAFKTPFESKDIMAAGQQFLAAGDSAQLAEQHVKQLGDIAAVGGGNMQLMALAMSQVFGKGKMDVVDMKQIINDGGAGIIKTLAGMHGGMGQLLQDFQDGKVSSGDLQAAMDKATSAGGFAFQGAQKQADTFNGRMSNLKDTVTQFGMKLMGVKLDPKLGLQVQKGGIFDDMSNGILRVTNAIGGNNPQFNHFLENVKQLADRVANTLWPSLEALWHTFEEKLYPSVKRLLPFLEFTAKVLGVELVVAAWASINILNLLANTAGWLGQVISNTGQMFVNVWRWIQNTWSSAYPFFAGVASSISGPFRSAFNFIAAAWNNTIGRLHFKFPSWVPGMGGKSLDMPGIPYFATGVTNFGGGLAIVGENGPELVSLPQGSNVYSNGQSQNMARNTTNNRNIHIGTVVVSDGESDRFFKYLDQDSLLLRKGLTPRMGGI